LRSRGLRRPLAADEYPREWDYAGRERMLFAAERAIHERSLEAYALPQLPPEVRVARADGDRRAAGCQPRVVGHVSSPKSFGAAVLRTQMVVGG
jgi:hypothetical protein